MITCAGRAPTNTATLSAFCAPLRSPPRQRRSLSPGVWTCIGGLAIPLWATWPALSLQTRQMPPFECLMILFLIAWLAMLCLERPPATLHGGPLSRTSWIPAVMFALAEVGSSAFFLLATHHIAAAEANLIVYLWPGVTVGLGALLGRFRLRVRHVIGITLGFVGAAVLTWGDSLALSYAGLGLAFLAGLSWAVYCVFRLTWRAPTGPLLARGFAISALVCGALHVLLEPAVMPAIASVGVAATIGIIPTAVANLAWDRGFRRGDGQLLAVMAYATPLCSAFLLAALGLEAFTWKLLVAAIIIAAAGLLSRADGQ
jgi:drug/metabolite transporter (DMT)-like permease